MGWIKLNNNIERFFGKKYYDREYYDREYCGRKHYGRKYYNGKKKSRVNTVKAVFTVEAAVIVPVILFTILGGFNLGYDMFGQSKADAEIHEELNKLDPVKIVRRNILIQSMKK